MNWFYAIFLGLVQGITEFLPVSSSGHLAIFQHFFNLNSPEESNLFFDVLLHLGTLVAVFVAFWPDIVALFRGLFSWLRRLVKKSEAQKDDLESQRMIFLLIIATVPLVAVLFFKDTVEGLYQNLHFVASALIITGLVIFLSDRFPRGRKNAKTARVLDAVLVGVAQVFATLPGISRSGMTICTGLSRGFDRKFAVKFSFIMSIPAILAANLLSLVDAVQAGIDWGLMPQYMVGMLVAAVSGYCSIQLVNKLVTNDRFGKFSYYCLIVGAVVLFASIVFPG